MEVRDRDRQMARNDNGRRYLSSVSLRRGGCLVEEVRDRERQKNEKTASIQCLSKFLSLSLALSLSLSLFLSVFLDNHTSVYLSLALPLDINMVSRRLVWVVSKISCVRGKTSEASSEKSESSLEAFFFAKSEKKEGSAKGA